MSPGLRRTLAELDQKWSAIWSAATKADQERLKAEFGAAMIENWPVIAAVLRRVGR